MKANEALSAAMERSEVGIVSFPGKRGKTLATLVSGSRILKIGAPVLDRAKRGKNGVSIAVISIVFQQVPNPLTPLLSMSTLYGLWIDHSHAFLLKANDTDVIHCERIDSSVEPHHHGGVTQEHLTITNQNKDAERRQNQMQQFCKRLMERLKDADEIVIFGPGNAKFELKNFLEKSSVLHQKLIALETTDKLSENQMKAYTRELFQLPREV